MRATVVTLNWNGWSDTIDLLESLKEVEYQPLSVAIVDNNSSDDSVERLENWLSGSGVPHQIVKVPKSANGGSLEEIVGGLGDMREGFNLVCSEANLGFCRGNNLGMEWAFHSGSDVALVLNNDTVVTPEFLAPMVQAVEKDPNVGVVGGLITYCSEPETIWYAGGRFTRFLTTVRLGNGQPLSSIQTEEPFETEWVSGCMTMIPSWTYAWTKGFSEEYFIWSEEWDHSLRVSRAGYRLLVVPTARICHKVGKSLGIMQPLNYYYGIRNGLLFQRKFLRPALFFLYFSYYLVNRLIRYSHLAIQGRPDLARAGTAAIRDFILGRHGMWKSQ